MYHKNMHIIILLDHFEVSLIAFELIEFVWRFCDMYMYHHGFNIVFSIMEFSIITPWYHKNAV